MPPEEVESAQRVSYKINDYHLKRGISLMSKEQLVVSELDAGGMSL